MESDLGFLYLKRKIIANGINCTGYKDDFLKRRFEGRMRLKGLGTFAEYAHYIDKTPAEFKDLLDALTINVSEFYRDATVWDVLRRDILPAMVKEKLASGRKELKTWSAGCADGEETYTVALIILETLSYLYKSFKIEVLGTDVDLASLNRAKRGVYAPVRLKPVSQLILQRYFTPCENGNFKISEVVKSLVTFKTHDLFTSPPSSGLDIITCRNVIIYFSRELQLKLFRNFYDALAPGGFLILGKVESIIGDTTALFKCVNIAERIYRRSPDPALSSVPSPVASRSA
jgi:chemotaxis protein methyltransferase CheR